MPAPLAQAKLAEEAERFEDMVGFVTALAKQKTLSVEERNLLSVAFKNVVGSKRASWRILSGIEAKERETGDPARADRVGGLRGVVEEELAGVCTALLDLIDGTLLPKDATPEGIAFYNKMAGDYNRYMAEFATGPQRESAAPRHGTTQPAAPPRACPRPTPSAWASRSTTPCSSSRSWAATRKPVKSLRPRLMPA